MRWQGEAAALQVKKGFALEVKKGFVPLPEVPRSPAEGCLGIRAGCKRVTKLKGDFSRKYRLFAAPRR